MIWPQRMKKKRKMRLTMATRKSQLKNENVNVENQKEGNEDRPA